MLHLEERNEAHCKFPYFYYATRYNLNLIVNSFPLNNTGEQLDQRVMENNNSKPNANNIDNRDNANDNGDLQKFDRWAKVVKVTINLVK